MHRRFIFIISALTVTCGLVVPPSNAKPPGSKSRSDGVLSMQAAVSLSVQARDPSVRRFDEKAAALDNRAIADSQLPDPILRAGQFNVPIDTFDFGQEPSTQVRFDLLQKIPAGDTLHLKGQKRHAEARAEDAKAQLRESHIKLQTRLAWLELFYLNGAYGKVTENREAVRELVKVATAIFGTGRESSQDVLRAQVELSVLDDRLIRIRNETHHLKNRLVRLIGHNAANRPLSYRLPNLVPPPSVERLRQNLLHHPSILVDNAALDARSTEIDLAGAKYRPEWTAEVRYGIRNNDRPDLLTARIGMSLPIFPENRQDRQVEAAHHDHLSAQHVRDARLRDLKTDLERYHSDWQRVGERINLYKRVVTQRAKATTEASLAAYRAGHSDFAELIRSRLAELDAELTLLRLRVDRAKAHSNLLFIAGK